jgi:hypothetical protein
MQLVAYGAQDIYLTGNPQITFFKIVYRRHTNFALESIEQTFNGNADFGKKITCSISRNGDLITRIYLRMEIPAITLQSNTAFRWLDWLGHVLIKNVEIEIGGQRIDKHCGEWLHIWNELTQTSGRALGYANMVGNIPDLTRVVTNSTANPIVIPGLTLYVPLQFWFCRNPGLALPLIALQYHEVKINLELRDAKECYWAANYNAANQQSPYTFNQSAVTVPSMSSCSLYVDYIYLDTTERKRIAQVSHEYLIEQLQYVDESSPTKNPKIKLIFNHPCKALYFVAQKETLMTDSNGDYFGKQWFNFTDTQAPVEYANYAGGAPVISDFASEAISAGSGGGFTHNLTSVLAENAYTSLNGIKHAKLQLNGHDRFSPQRDSRYFNLVQPFQHMENIPTLGINVYSFALKPEEHQPSGSCNMSRIDTAMLNLTLNDQMVANNDNARIRIFTINYNVLRLMSGMGGLAYSN